MERSGALVGLAVAAASTAVAVVAGVAGFPLAWPAAVLLLGVVGLLAVRTRWPGVTVPLAVAFGVRSVVAALHWAGLPLPDDHVDAVSFERVAWEMAQGNVQAPPQGAYLYSWFLSLAYRVMGREPFAAEAFNVLLGTVVVLSAALLARELWGERAGRATAWATALFPTLVLYSVVLMREAALVAPMVAGTWTWMVWWRTSRPLPALATVALWTLPALMQPGLTFLAPSLAALALLRPLLRRLGTTRRVVVAALFVPLYLLGILAGSAAGWWLEADAGEDVGQGLGNVEDVQSIRTRGRASYPEWTVVDSPAEALLLGPLRVLMLLFAPLPWMVSAPLDLLGALDGLLFLALVAGLLHGRREVLGSQRALVVAAVVLVGIAIFAMGTSNYGTGIRHRAKFAPLLLALVPERTWSVRLPGRPEGTTLLGDLLSAQARAESWLRLGPRLGPTLSPRAGTR